jgi:hypothetical protein
MNERAERSSAQAQNSEQKPVLLGTLASGQQVFDRYTSHLHGDAAMEKLLQDSFANINLTDEEFVRAIIDFGAPIGETVCVTTRDTDKILYAQREKRLGLTRFVQERTPEPTSTLCVLLKKVPAGYIVITAFKGAPSELEPWDPNAGEPAKEFWSGHALLWGREKTVAGTETSVMPEAYLEKLPSIADTNVVRQPMKDLLVKIPPAIS